MPEDNKKEKEMQDMKVQVEGLTRGFKYLKSRIENPKKEGFEDIPKYDLLKVLKLYAGFPIFTATPTYTGFQGETVLVLSGGTGQICAFLSGTWKCGNLT